MNNLKPVIEIRVWDFSYIGAVNKTHKWRYGRRTFAELFDISQILIVHRDDVMKSIQIGFL